MSNAIAYFGGVEIIAYGNKEHDPIKAMAARYCSPSSAYKLAGLKIQTAQGKKTQHEIRTFSGGEWILLKFPKV